MRKGSTLFLRFTIYLIAFAVLALCAFILPTGIFSDNTGMYRPILIGMYVPAIPFFIGLYNGLKLIDYVEDNKVFSQMSVNALGTIKKCAGIVCALYVLGMPYIFYVADQDDAPGVALIGFVFIFASLLIATAAAIFQKLLKDAIDIKSDNELAV